MELPPKNLASILEQVPVRARLGLTSRQREALDIVHSAHVLDGLINPAADGSPHDFAVIGYGDGLCVVVRDKAAKFRDDLDSLAAKRGFEGGIPGAAAIAAAINIERPPAPD